VESTDTKVKAEQNTKEGPRLQQSEGMLSGHEFRVRRQSVVG
jgi:hypothetical protein